jgi:hypothetical protein
METLWQDIRYGARLLVRFPGVTAAALVALALGTGVNTALFSIVNAVLLTPLPFPDSHELLQVWRTELPRLQYGSASYPRYVDWRARNRAFDEMGAYTPAGLTLSGPDAPGGWEERMPRPACSGHSRRRQSPAAIFPTMRISRVARASSSSASRCGSAASDATPILSARR